MSQLADNQTALQSVSHQFDDWLTAARATMQEEITLDSSINELKSHIVKLHVSGRCLSLVS